MSYYLGLNLSTALYMTLFVPITVLFACMLLNWIIPKKKPSRYSAIDDYL